SPKGEQVIQALRPGQFSGEASMLAGRPALVRIRAAEPSVVIEVERERLLPLIQSDSQGGDVLMRAFLLRRAELMARELGDVVLLGSDHCSGTLRVKEFLNRNGHPYNYINLDREADVQDLLDRFHVTVADVPVLICGSDRVLRNPTNHAIADCLGFN